MHTEYETRRDAADALRSLDPGMSRDEWVKAGMAAKAAGLEFEDWHDWSAGAPNYDGEASCRMVWRSFKDGGGIGPGTLFSMARAAGWQANEAQHVTAPRKAPPKAQHDHAPAERPAADPAAIWEGCTPADAAHGYIARKGGSAEGLRVYRGPLKITGKPVSGWLAVPVRNLDGKLQAIQFFPPEAGAPKLTLPGSRISGGCFVVGGDLATAGRVYLVEGLATGWTAHTVGRAPAVVTFGTGNAGHLADALHARFPRLEIVVCLDRGQEAKAEEIARRVGGAWVELPEDAEKNADLADIQEAEGAEAVRAILDAARMPEPPPPPVLFPFIRVGDMLHHLKAIDWLIKGQIEADSLALLFGDPGSGKSFIAVDMACCVATGHPWHGRPTKQGAVFYLAGEGHNGMARRFKAWEIANGRSLTAAPIFKSARAALLYDEASAELIALTVETIAKETGMPPRLIVIDTLARNFGGDENSTPDMAAFVSNLDAIRERFGATILLVHHTGHADKTRARGSMALKGALDAEYLVTQEEAPEGGKITRLASTKMKDAETPEPLAFAMEHIELPFLDEDGAPVSSLAPRLTDAPPKAEKPKASSKPLDYIRQAVMVTGSNEKEVVRKQFYALYEGNEEAKRKAFIRGWKTYLDGLCADHDGEHAGHGT